LLVTKTLRRRFFGVPGRLVRSARRLGLRLPDRWPWPIRSCARSRHCEPSPRSHPCAV